MPILRNKTQNNFTMINNDILRNRELSLKDRGLLCTLISLPDSWAFSIRGLAATIPDGKDSIGTSLIKLEKLGYLKRYNERDVLGRFQTIIEILPDNSPDDPDKGELDDLELSYASSAMEESDDTDASDVSDQPDSSKNNSDTVKKLINDHYLCETNPTTTRKSNTTIPNGSYPPPPPLVAIRDGFTVTDNPARLNRLGEADTANPPQYNTYNIINTCNNINNKSIIHSINAVQETESANDTDRMNDRSINAPYEHIDVRRLTPFLMSTQRRVDFAKLKENLTNLEMKYVNKMVTLIATCLSRQNTEHPIKIAGKYLGPEAVAHLLRYKYDELFAVAKNMFASNIPVDKPESYYLTALDNQLRINNPAAFSEMEAMES